MFLFFTLNVLRTCCVFLGWEYGLGVNIGTAFETTFFVGDMGPMGALKSNSEVGDIVASTVEVNFGEGIDCCLRYFNGLGSSDEESKPGSTEWLLSKIFGITKRSRTASLMVNLSMYFCSIFSASSLVLAFL